jgi:hypothetical protein
MHARVIVAEALLCGWPGLKEEVSSKTHTTKPTTTIKPRVAKHMISHEMIDSA